MSGVDWNAVAYDGLSDPMFEWGLAVLDTIALKGDERVLDAGCGSGRLTEELLKRLPQGEVVALDLSPTMLRQARERLGGDARVSFLEASLESFVLGAPVDGIFSNAVLHWVPDHRAMFVALRGALKPGGWLVAQFGGRGNLEKSLRWVSEIAAEAPFAEFIAGAEAGPHFEGEAETRERMESAGFREVEARLHQVMPHFEQRERFEAFCETVILRQMMAPLPSELRALFLRRVSERVWAEEGRYVLDYVRLTVRARA